MVLQAMFNNKHYGSGISFFEHIRDDKLLRSSTAFWTRIDRKVVDTFSICFLERISSAENALGPLQSEFERQCEFIH